MRILLIFGTLIICCSAQNIILQIDQDVNQNGCCCGGCGNNKCCDKRKGDDGEEEDPVTDRVPRMTTEEPKVLTTIPQATTGAPQPTTTAAQPTTGPLQPTTTAAQPTTGPPQPTTTAAQPTTGPPQPTTTAAQPTTTAAQPPTTIAQPTTTTAQPTTTTAQPTTTTAQPTTTTAQPTTTTAKAATTQEVVPTTCPTGAGYKVYQGYCYFHTETPTKWADGETRCRQLAGAGFHFFVPLDASMATTLKGEVLKTITPNHWAGIHAVGGAWKTYDDKTPPILPSGSILNCAHYKAPAGFSPALQLTNADCSLEKGVFCGFKLP